MIRIEFVEPTDDKTWKRWRTACEKETRNLVEAVARGEPVDIKNTYKRRSIRDKYYRNARGPFHNRCAYCETKIAGFDGEIEHFRPKDTVSDAANKPVSRSAADDREDTHKGYYWLAYDWQNLLLSCRHCNAQPKKIREPDGSELLVGKGNRFPVEDEGERAWGPNDVLQSEAPMLINPLHEDPEEHLAADAGDGIMLHKTERGKACIDIFGLNVRDGLIGARKDAVIRMQDALMKHLLAKNGSDEERDAKTRVLALWEGAESHTLVARAFYESKLQP